MKLKVKKISQGPVLAKGTAQVTDSTSCGVVRANGTSVGGCSTDTGNGGTLTYGVSPRNGGSAQAQYTSSVTCC